MNKRMKLLLTIGSFAIMIVIYQLLIIVPEIAEYASKAHLFEEAGEGLVWKEWVLEAREMFWKALIGLILQVCFFTSMAFWSFYEATQETMPRREKTIPKKIIPEKSLSRTLSRKTGERIFALSIFAFLIVYFWQMIGILSSPMISPTIDYFMTFGMPLLIASLVSIVVGIVAYLIAKLS